MEIEQEKQNFRRLTKNPFFRANLLEVFRNKCARCGNRLSSGKNNWHVHHLTYDHSCIYKDLVLIEVRRVRRGKEQLGILHTTQCERCYSETKDAFMECQKRVIPLCTRCHFKGHRADIVEFKKRKASGESVDRDFMRDKVNARYEDEVRA